MGYRSGPNLKISNDDLDRIGQKAVDAAGRIGLRVAELENSFR
jgi:hypothetical protein